MMSNDVEKGTLGSSFESFLKSEGTFEETTERAIKRVIAFQMSQIMKEKAITKVDMAKRLETSRTQVDRLLDPDHDGVTLATLSRAAEVLGHKLSVQLT